ncbi:MAG: EI24 domain-containing protein [Deltaproteobacteria bacterium]|nr:EI24 domain-containing protein [Deltaproteobacteria bacterium]
MNILNGVLSNIRGLWLGLKTPKLLFLGLVRFAVILVVTIVAAWLILFYHGEILELIWKKPESHLIVWLWHIVSWFLSFLLVGISAIISYLLAQILFAVVLMDLMSRVTERLLTGSVLEPKKIPLVQLFFSLVRQEVPRMVIPVLISLVLMVLGWVTPIGPIIMILSSGAAVIFLAWDNTDLVPARRMDRFKDRFRFLLKNLLFHLGFGLPFLIPGLNILLLSFAPVGGTIYHVERQKKQEAGSGKLMGNAAGEVRNAERETGLEKPAIFSG